jgi:GH15 family glucan-1,4-alpha-glucosidase
LTQGTGLGREEHWFGQDEVMTYAAFGVHRKLVEEEGFDPQSDEYYSEIDRRVRAEFPHKFKTAKTFGEESGRTCWLFGIPQYKTGAQDRQAVTVADRHCEKAERSSRGICKVRKGLI